MSSQESDNWYLIAISLKFQWYCIIPFGETG